MLERLGKVRSRVTPITTPASSKANALAGTISTGAMCKNEGPFACGKSVATTVLGFEVNSLIPGLTLPARIGRAALSAYISKLGF